VDVKANSNNDRPVISSDDIDAAQRLIAAQCPQVRGLMEPRVVLRAAIETPSDRASSLSESTRTGDTAVSLQILRVNGDHWVTVACIAGVLTVSAHTQLHLNVHG